MVRRANPLRYRKRVNGSILPKVKRAVFLSKLRGVPGNRHSYRDTLSIRKHDDSLSKTGLLWAYNAVFDSKREDIGAKNANFWDVNYLISGS
jgi:hypothetical protein